MIKFLKSALLTSILLLPIGEPARAQSSFAIGQPGTITCSQPDPLLAGQRDQPMEFMVASNKGNMTTSVWIAAMGTIEADTAEKFRHFLDSLEYPPTQIVLHSPGGDLQAGLDLGRSIRAAELTTHIGQTARSYIEGYGECDTWYDEVYSGMCASACAYAFLGGQTRFVESPYYPTERNLLGFHQFYSGHNAADGIISNTELQRLASNSISTAQYVAGAIALYLADMEIDPRVFSLAANTPSETMYFPTAEEIFELKIASQTGLSAWTMEPYSSGLVTISRPMRPDSSLVQLTAFCAVGRFTPALLITYELEGNTVTSVEDLPIFGVNLIADGTEYSVQRPELGLRISSNQLYITIEHHQLASVLGNTSELEINLNAARSMGGFRERGKLEAIDQKALSLAWKNCI